MQVGGASMREKAQQMGAGGGVGGRWAFCMNSSLFTFAKGQPRVLCLLTGVTGWDCDLGPPCPLAARALAPSRPASPWRGSRVNSPRGVSGRETLLPQSS